MVLRWLAFAALAASTLGGSWQQSCPPRFCRIEAFCMPPTCGKECCAYWERFRAKRLASGKGGGRNGKWSGRNWRSSGSGTAHSIAVADEYAEAEQVGNGLRMRISQRQVDGGQRSLRQHIAGCKLVVNSGGAAYTRPRLSLILSLYATGFSHWSDVIFVLGGGRGAQGGPTQPPTLVPLSHPAIMGNGSSYPFAGGDRTQVVLVRVPHHNYDFHALDALSQYRTDPLVDSHGYVVVHDTSSFAPRFRTAFQELRGVFEGSSRSKRVIFTTPLPNGNICAFSAGVVSAYADNFATLLGKNGAIQLEYGKEVCLGKGGRGGHCIFPLSFFGDVKFLAARKVLQPVDVYNTGVPRVVFHLGDLGIYKFVLWGGSGDMESGKGKTQAATKANSQKINVFSSACKASDCLGHILATQRVMREDVRGSPFINGSSPFRLGRYACTPNSRLRLTPRTGCVRPDGAGFTCPFRVPESVNSERACMALCDASTHCDALLVNGAQLCYRYQLRGEAAAPELAARLDGPEASQAEQARRLGHAGGGALLQLDADDAKYSSLFCAKAVFAAVA